MRKFYLFLMSLLLCAGTTWAALPTIEASKTYLMKARCNGMIYWLDMDTPAVGANPKLVTSQGAASPVQLAAIDGQTNTYSIESVNHPGRSLTATTWNVIISESVHGWAVLQETAGSHTVTDGYFYIYHEHAGNAGYLKCDGPAQGNNDFRVFGNQSASASDFNTHVIEWQLVEVTDTWTVAAVGGSLENTGQGGVIYDGESVPAGEITGSENYQANLFSAGSVAGYTATVDADESTHIVTVTYRPTVAALTFDDGLVLNVSGATRADGSRNAIQTSSDTESHWYMIAQDRKPNQGPVDNYLTPCIFTSVGGNIKRASFGSTPESYNGLSLNDATKKVIVRFLPAGFSIGGQPMYYIQYANGNFITSPIAGGKNVTLTATADTPRPYSFYLVNADSTAWGWNQIASADDPYGWSVNNQGAGNNVLFWNSGEKTATHDNGCFYVYEVSLEQATDYTVHVSGLPGYEVAVGGFKYGDTEVHNGGTISKAAASDTTLFSAIPVTGYSVQVTHDEAEIRVVYQYIFPAISTNATGKYLHISETATPMSSLQASTATEDHWYLFTQTRDAFGPMADRGVGQNVAREHITIDSLQSMAYDAAAHNKLLVRFIKREEANATRGAIYDLQFLTGNYVGHELNSHSQSDADFIVYGLDGTTDGIGWNLYNNETTPYGQRVDNNPGNPNPLVFFGNSTTSADNNTWRAYEVTFTDQPAVAVVYNVTKDGTVLYTETHKLFNGDALPAPAMPRQLQGLNVTLALPEEGMTCDGTARTVELNYSAPWFTSDVNNVEHWLAIAIHRNDPDFTDRLIQHDTNDATNVSSASVGNTKFTTGQVAGNDMMWALVGDPFTGVKLYNKGAQKYLSQPTDADTKAVWADDGEVFQICDMTSNYTANAFALKVAGRSYYLNHRTPYVQGWTAADGGSGFHAWEVTTLEEEGTTTVTFNNQTNGYWEGYACLYTVPALPAGLKAYKVIGLNPSGTVNMTTGENSMYVLEEVTSLEAGNAYILWQHKNSGPTAELSYTARRFATGRVTTGILMGFFETTPVSDLNASDDMTVGKFREGFVLHFEEVAGQSEELEAGDVAIMTDAGTVVGVGSVKAAKKGPKAIYTIDGIRVKEALKGLYIIDGKKVMK